MSSGRFQHLAQTEGTERGEGKGKYDDQVEPGLQQAEAFLVLLPCPRLRRSQGRGVDPNI